MSEDYDPSDVTRVYRTYGPDPLAAWFLGPKSEHGDLWAKFFSDVLQDYLHWRRNYFPTDRAVISPQRQREHKEWFDRLRAELDAILGELKAHFPFYSPRYVAHMLSEQTLPAVLGYFAVMLYNPNNVTSEAAPVTVRLEREAGRMVADMLGYGPDAWAHLCSGGTVANIEALWVARAAQFAPLVVREFCRERRVDLTVNLAPNRTASIQDLDDHQLIGLSPGTSSSLFHRLANHLTEQVGQPVAAVMADISRAWIESEFNCQGRGLPAVLARLGLRPRILASAAAHYSVRKAANVLGYGEDSLRLVPVDRRFRIDVETLAEMLHEVPADEYVAAVVGVVGTTEEGAIDPIHRILALRERWEQERQQSFWLHLDAAWGGYFRSVFCGHEPPLASEGQPLVDVCRSHAQAILAVEDICYRLSGGQCPAVERIAWDDPEVYAALLSMGQADSITVDPHKMGYVPYPAGIVAFRSRHVRQLIAQEAHYISDVQQGLEANEDSGEEVGPYILEGSKPGAAAASCWLAHTLIPLRVQGHGKIVRTTVLNARKLVRYLVRHRDWFVPIDREMCGPGRCARPFTFQPLSEPDTNIVCFVALPMVWQDERLVATHLPLPWINRLNQEIHEALSIKSSGPRVRLPYAQTYFVSRTRFEQRGYTSESLRELLSELGVAREEYEQHGLFVLRSTLMNPLHWTAEQEGTDYLLDFVKHLHVVARRVMERVDARGAEQAPG
jgi:glutamate/tyrosine decarboxylase-like PLP-dependent enzyme